MIKELDEDMDGKINFREVIQVYSIVFDFLIKNICF